MIIEALQSTLIQFFVLLGPGLMLAYLMNLVAGGVELKAYQVLGRKIYLWGFGWLGTMIHELGHAIMCVLFGHKIQKMVLFNPDPNSPSLGSVEHSHNPKNFYHIIGNFFIGIGPIILGTLVIYTISLFLLPESFNNYARNLKITHEVLLGWNSIKEFGWDVYGVFQKFLSDSFTTEALSNWKIYVFCYLLFCIGSSMKLSSSDIKSAVHGFLVILGLAFLINLTLIYLDLTGKVDEFLSLATCLSAFYLTMLFALILNILVLLSLSAIHSVKSLF